uniref:Ferredoxin-5 n=1 Tax=Magnetococcus massalia (strain MO-1) TaxID=451514 RepID=A0A1S7LCI3_MAGMO|nr:Ferredoxin-5 [Candidatus Magnetococcus massalia]
MPNITFSSPVMNRDITVYAVAGHNGTMLTIANKENIKIPFDCQDGECGSCIIEVKQLSGKPTMGMHLTDKEKEVLLSMGKISKDEIAKCEVDDLPPKYRLACQFIARDEDVLVTFSGQPTITP